MDVLYTFLGIITRKLITAALDRFIGSKKPRSLKIRMWHPDAPANFNNFVYCNEISKALTKGYVPCRAFYAMVQLRNNGMYVLMLRARPNRFRPNSWLLPTMPSTEHDESLLATAMRIAVQEFYLDDRNPERAAEIQTYTTAVLMRASFVMLPGWLAQIGTNNFRTTQVNQVCFSVVPPMTPEPTIIVRNIYTHAQWMRVDDVIQHLITTGITTGTTDINSLVVLHYIRWALEIPEIVALLQRQPPQNQNQ